MCALKYEKRREKKQRERKKPLQNTRDQTAIFVSDWLIIALVFKQITNHGSWKSEEILDCF